MTSCATLPAAKVIAALPSVLVTEPPVAAEMNPGGGEAGASWVVVAGVASMYAYVAGVVEAGGALVVGSVAKLGDDVAVVAALDAAGAATGDERSTGASVEGMGPIEFSTTSAFANGSASARAGLAAAGCVENRFVWTGSLIVRRARAGACDPIGTDWLATDRAAAAGSEAAPAMCGTGRSVGTEMPGKLMSGI
jgi:hypothetical protein